MIFHRPFLRGLSREEICVSKSIGIYRFALFYFVFEGKFPSTSPRGAYIWRGDHLMEGFCVTGFGGLEGLIFGILWYLLARRRDATHPIPFQMFLLYLPFIHFEFFFTPVDVIKQDPVQRVCEADPSNNQCGWCIK